jgi:hypothetical protein
MLLPTRSIQQLQIKNNQLSIILKLNVHLLIMKLVVIKKMKVNGLHKINRSIIVIEIKEKMKHQMLLIKNHHPQHPIVRMLRKNEQHQQQPQIIFHHQQINTKLMLNQPKHQLHLFHRHRKFKNQLKLINYYQQLKIVIPLVMIGGNRH